MEARSEDLSEISKRELDDGCVIRHGCVCCKKVIEMEAVKVEQFRCVWCSSLNSGLCAPPLAESPNFQLQPTTFSPQSRGLTTALPKMEKFSHKDQVKHSNTLFVCILPCSSSKPYQVPARSLLPDQNLGGTLLGVNIHEVC
jgi:hypothetical protein